MSRLIADNDCGMNEYQIKALDTASYPRVGYNTIYPALKLAGEAGETADKIGKWWRNHGIVDGQHLSEKQKEELVLELGDVLWYIAALGMEIGVSLSDIANKNKEKLQSRKERGVIKGEGDNR